MTSSESPVKLELTLDEAIVLFDFLHRFEDTEKLDLQHPAEELVLWRLSGLLERLLVEPFDRHYAEIVEQARARLRPDQD
jgi:hypothetical protein